MKFKDHQHRQFYQHMFNAANCINDGNHRGLFYLLSLLSETRRNISEFYDYERDAIRTGGLAQPWQTAGSILITRLAFHLFNGFKGFNGERQIEPESLYMPEKLFDPALCEYCLEACRLRYDYLPRYERETGDDAIDDLDFNVNLDWDNPRLQTD
jgi:hypothetical protein